MSDESYDSQPASARVTTMAEVIKAHPTSKLEGFPSLPLSPLDSGYHIDIETNQRDNT